MEEEQRGDRRLEESEQEAMSHERDSPLDLKIAKALEENGEQEGEEPIRNGAENVLEGEGGNGQAGCLESPSEAPACQYKPGELPPNSWFPSLLVSESEVTVCF